MTFVVVSTGDYYIHKSNCHAALQTSRNRILEEASLQFCKEGEQEVHLEEHIP